MAKQLVYESANPGNLGVRKSVKTFNKLTGEPEVRRSIHVLFERQQTKPDAEKKFRVYGIATINEQFCEDHEIGEYKTKPDGSRYFVPDWQLIDDLIMQPKFRKVFGPIKRIVGPDTKLPKAVEIAEAEDAGDKVPEEPKPKAKK